MLLAVVASALNVGRMVVRLSAPMALAMTLSTPKTPARSELPVTSVVESKPALATLPSTPEGS